MKKISLILTTVLLATSFCGCMLVEETDITENPSEETKTDISENIPPTETTDENEKQQNDPQTGNEDFGFITVSKAQKLIEEWGEEQLDYEVSWQHLKLSDEDAERYPLLAEYFDVMNSESDTYAFDAREDFEYMVEEYPYESRSWHYYQNTEYYLQRADKLIVSILSNYSDYKGGAHGYYAYIGRNINPETGKDIKLDDVITDRDSLDKLIYDRLIEENPQEIREENRQSFYDTYSEYGYIWSMDYDKLSVYFNPYEIASYAAGLLRVDIWFDENPELFREEYIKAPSSYALELPQFISQTFDIEKTDGKRDTISVGAYEIDGYECGEINISINENEYTEKEVYGTSLTPFLLCIEGNYYLYAETGEFDGSDSMHIYKVNRDGVEKVDRLPVGFIKLWDYGEIQYGGNYREIVNNPCSMNLQSTFKLIDTRNTAYKCYSAGLETGIPESKDEVYRIGEDNYRKTLLKDIPAKSCESGTTVVLPSDSIITLLYTDCKSYLDVVDENGKEYRIDVTASDSGNTVDGIDVSECFTDVLPDYGF